MVVMDAGDWINVVPNEAREILSKLALVWNDAAAPEPLEVIPLKVEEGTATNKVFGIRWKTDELQDGEVTHKKVVLRIYAEGMQSFFDREKESMILEAVSRQGQGPRLIGTFANGRVEEFLNGRSLLAKDIRDQEMTAIIAKKLREFHDLEMPGPKEVILWDRLKNWHEVVKRVSTPDEDKEFCLNKIEEEIISLQNELSNEDERIGFCHNDLWYGNMMIDEETKRLTIIDCEHAGFNPIAFDIANYFCSMGIDYDPTEALLTFDFIKYPDFGERKRFVQIYLNSTDEDPKDTEVEILLQDIEKYVLASHLWWGLWLMIVDHVSDGRLGYKPFIRRVFRQFWLRKSQMSALDAT